MRQFFSSTTSQSILRINILLAAIFLGIPLESTAASPPPNILMILVDDLGYGDLSSYGAADLKTPRVDALIKSGFRMDNFYANCPVCSPTRASLLTGRYPDVVGVPGVIRTHPENSWGYLDPKATLLPQRLKTAGYHTAIIGKWHLGLTPEQTPNARGFDFFHGYLGDMMDDYYTHRRHGINYMHRNGQEIDPKGHATDLFSQWAVDYLKDRKSASDPFFLYLAYNAPHTPIQPPPDWLKKVRQRQPGMTEKRAKLVALIEHMDHGIGQVLDALKAHGLDKNTLVIFTSDNGGQANVGAHCGPYRGEKQDMYEGGLRVPFGASWPGHIQPGTRSEVVALTMDLFPTICQAAGVAPGENIEGISILDLLTGQPQVLPQRDLFWVRREGGNRYRGQDYHAMRRGPWKLVQNHPFEPYQLYNLETDSRETTDVIGQETKIARSMIESLKQHFQKAGQVPWQAR